MKKFIFGFTTLFLIVSSNLYAGDVKVSGYADAWTTLSSSVKSNAIKTGTKAEVDFEKTDGKITVRVDVDLPGAAIEQAKITQGLGDSMSLTAGKFNAPIGFESQDAPDMWQYSNGQLFGLTPDNLTGLMFSWWAGPASLDLYLANDKSGVDGATPEAFDNSLGANAKLAAGPANVQIGLVTTEAASGNLMDVVVSGNIPAGGMDTAVAFEYLKDDSTDGWGLTANHMHGVHGLTFRYDSVTPKGGKDTKTMTLALLCNMSAPLSTRVEYKKTDNPTGTDPDQIVIQWVAKF